MRFWPWFRPSLHLLLFHPFPHILWILIIHDSLICIFLLISPSDLPMIGFGSVIEWSESTFESYFYLGGGSKVVWGALSSSSISDFVGPSGISSNPTRCRLDFDLDQTSSLFYEILFYKCLYSLINSWYSKSWERSSR
jgi:hypothetical protein